MTEPSTPGRLAHLHHRERDLVARLELAKERLAFFPNRMAERQVATLSAEHEELTAQLNALAASLGKS